MGEASPRKIRREFRTRVLSAHRLTPNVVRLVLIGEDLSEFADLGWADHYVKFVLPPEGDLPAAVRSYTVRSWDSAAGELTIDVVVHGSRGRVGPWAAAAQPGDEMLLRGQGGGYVPDDEYAWHLLVGDESALPAIAVAIESMPPGARARALIVETPDEEQTFPTAGDVEITWIHRGVGGVYGAGLVRAVREMAFGPGHVQVFLHGEAGMVRELRRHLRKERGVPKTDLSASGYWRLGRDDEAWRAEKSEWKAAVEADEAELP